MDQSREFLDELMNLPTVYKALRSPDGELVALNVLNLHSNLDIFFTKAENPQALVPLTNTKELTVFYQWWPDSTSILLGQDTGRNERITLYQVFVNQPEIMNPLTELTPDFYLRTPSVSPNGKVLYYFANYDFSKNTETEISYLFRHNLGDNKPEAIAFPDKPAYNMAFLSLKGSHLLYNRSDIHPGGDQWWIINSDGTQDREILNFGDEAKVQASWHPDSENIVFVTDSFNGERLKTRLTGLCSIKNESFEWINKSGDLIGPDLSNHDFNQAKISRYEPEILILNETLKSKTKTYFYNLKSYRVTPFPELKGTLLPTQKLVNSRWLGQFYSSVQPTTYVSFPVDDLESLNEDHFRYYFDTFSFSKIKKTNLVPAEEFEWKSKDGTPIHGWLYPSFKKTHQAILYIHGGPTWHSEDSFNSEIQYYVLQGFNVLDPNYRGSTGYGVEFRELIKKEGWGAAEQVDIVTGAEALVEKGLASLQSIGITGTSFGGFSSWYALTKFSDVFGAGAPVCGMTDLVVDYNTTRPDLRPYSAEMMGGTPEEVPDRYYSGSPINFVHNIKGNVLIVQGLNDPNVTPENVRVVEEALKKHNVAYEKLAFDDEGHGVYRRKNRKKKIITITRFFNKNLA
ncbi:MAG: S9 family peptidase [Candidatus Heimdallarchaeota archaeon]|nr:MAG: S9 family peptidase [Candidatus Heimdallarchaeota archaeon]